MALPPPTGNPIFGPEIADPPRGVPRIGTTGPANPPSETDPNPQGPTGADALGSGLDSIGKALNPLAGLTDIAGLALKAATWIADRHNWIRILEIGLGLAGVFVGLELVSRELREVTKSAASGAALAAAA